MLRGYKKTQLYQWKRKSAEVKAIKTKEKHILPQHINSDHRVGGNCGESVLWWSDVVWCVCVCVVAGFSVQQWSMKLLLCWCLSHCQQVKPARWRETEGEWGRWEWKREGDRDLKAKTILSSVPLNIYCFFKKRAAFSIFDVLLSSTWTARSLKLTRTKPD